MKIRILSIALVAALAATACARDDAAADTTPADAAAAATDAMAADTAATDAAATEPAPAADPAAAATTDIVAGATASPDHSTLVTAVKAAGLVETLQGAGPFTVFAPTNAAFDKLPAGTVDGLLKPEMKADLTKVLTYHVVSGNVDSAALASQIEAGGGKATLTTVQGGTLTAAMEGGNVVITDAKGGKSTVTTADLRQSNGVIHVVDTVLMP